MAKSRTRKSAKKGRVAYENRANRQLKGFMLSWSDLTPPPAPQRTMSDWRPGHSNYVYKNVCGEIWNRSAADLREHRRMLWRLTVTAVGELKGTIHYETIQGTAFCALNELDESCEEMILEVTRPIESLTRCDFTVECLGHREPKDTDYEFEDGKQEFVNSAA